MLLRDHFVRGVFVNLSVCHTLLLLASHVFQGTLVMYLLSCYIYIAVQVQEASVQDDACQSKEAETTPCQGRYKSCKSQ